MFLLLVSIFFNFNTSSAYAQCNVIINDVKNKTVATLTLEKRNTNDDKLTLQENDSSKGKPILVSYDLDGSVSSDDADTPDRTTDQINNEYKESVKIIKQTDALISVKKRSLLVKVDKSSDCTDQRLAIMLFFMQNYFYAK